MAMHECYVVAEDDSMFSEFYFEFYDHRDGDIEENADHIAAH